MSTAWRIAADVIVAFIVVMFVRLVFDYVQLFAREWRPRGAVLVALETCYSITDPPLKFVHRLLPPLRVGAFSADWTVAWIAVIGTAYILLSVVGSL
jgi:YggT family protein